MFLDATPAFENEIACFLRYDDEHHRLVVMNIPALEAAPAVPVAGVEHYAFTFATMGDLLSNYLRMKEAGVAPAWCINHGPATSIYYRDPDGNLVEAQFDNLDVDDADAFLRGPYFAKNPIGVDFDPEVLIERYRRGDAMEELIRQGAAPPRGDALPVRPSTVPDYDYRGELLGA